MQKHFVHVVFVHVVFVHVVFVYVVFIVTSHCCEHVYDNDDSPIVTNQLDRNK